MGSAVVENVSKLLSRTSYICRNCKFASILGIISVENERIVSFKGIEFVARGVCPGDYICAYRFSPRDYILGKSELAS